MPTFGGFLPCFPTLVTCFPGPVSRTTVEFGWGWIKFILRSLYCRRKKVATRGRKSVQCERKVFCLSSSQHSERDVTQEPGTTRLNLSL